MKMKPGQLLYGVSTLWMPSPGATLFAAIELAKEDGFPALEIVPTQAPQGDWYSLGFSPGDVDTTFYEKLAEHSASFPCVTVHSPHTELNIASRNPVIRRESVRQYLQCIEIARLIGAKVVTFHHGAPPLPVTIDKEEFDLLVAYNVEFALQAAELAEKYGLEMGFENLGGPTAKVERELLGEILHRVKNPRFGINLDIGHVHLADGDPLGWIRDFGTQIKEVHTHGTYCRLDRNPPFINHSPLEMETRSNLQEIFHKLKNIGFFGPFIFEIFAPDLLTYLKFAQQGKDLLLRVYGG